MSPLYNTGCGQNHTSSLWRNFSTTRSSALDTNTPVSYGWAGFSELQARKPAEYQVWNQTFSKTSIWCAENSLCVRGSPGPPAKQFSGRFSGSMYVETTVR